MCCGQGYGYKKTNKDENNNVFNYFISTMIQTNSGVYS